MLGCHAVSVLVSVAALKGPESTVCDIKFTRTNRGRYIPRNAMNHLVFHHLPAAVRNQQVRGSNPRASFLPKDRWYVLARCARGGDMDE